MSPTSGSARSPTRPTTRSSRSIGRRRRVLEPPRRRRSSATPKARRSGAAVAARAGPLSRRVRRRGVARRGDDHGWLGRSVELARPRRDGSEVPVELSLSTWKAGDDVFYTGVIRDITERKQAAEALRQREEQLRQAQKMEAVGPAGRRHRARLQQPADRDPRLRRPAARRAAGRGSDARRPRGHPEGRPERARRSRASCSRSAASRCCSPSSWT